MSSLDLTGVTLLERSPKPFACGLNNSFYEGEKDSTLLTAVSETNQDEIDYCDLLLFTKNLQKIQDERELRLNIATKTAEEAQCRLRKARLEALQDRMHFRTSFCLSTQKEEWEREMEETTQEVVILSSSDAKLQVHSEFSLYSGGNEDLYGENDNRKGTFNSSVASLALPWYQRLQHSLYRRIKCTVSRFCYLPGIVHNNNQCYQDVFVTD
ncbi:unnamed protein product [Phytomonas sp. EM1]|nr:unnamed protein product [Phytomonas sp. EM1]|eukprot:CCW60540.1 unnamed protein product [Phytomonas sp. isolate EM1]